MPLVPFAPANSLRKRPLVSAVLGTVIVYQAILANHFSGLDAGLGSLPAANPAQWSFYGDFLLGLFRGAEPVAALFLLLFWYIFGPLLEQSAGRTLLITVFLAGAIVPFLFATREWIAWEGRYWPGLGGTMACIGLAYYKIWEEEVRVFYMILLRMGFSTTPSIFLLAILHVLLTLGQYVHYSSRMGETPPPGLSTLQWLFLLPLVVAGICLAVHYTTELLKGGEEVAA